MRGLFKLVSKVIQYFHTLKYLKASQCYWQVIRRLYRPGLCQTLDAGSVSRKPVGGEWKKSVLEEKAFFSNGHLSFLNVSVPLNQLVWKGTSEDHPELDKLWFYNLHYFKYLLSQSPKDVEQGLILLDRWITECPFYSENAWEPYTISLRIVNLIKFSLEGGQLSEQVYRSLFLQARYLAKIPEYHILANHLFENAKALVFAGLFFRGEEPTRWFKLGWKILTREVREQILDDGGHFELSPMYHAIILEGMLDLKNIFFVYQEVFPKDWEDRIVKMLDWLAIMSHPDGDVSFFNDSTLGVAPKPVDLFEYGARLGFEKPKALADGIYHLKSSGYIRAQKGPWVVLIDCAEIGPCYQPGHAHADTLSFELSFREERVFVNSGTSSYQDLCIRRRERSTRAHNTVVVSDKNSSEIWGGFRVARRAVPYDLDVREGREGAAFEISCKHAGYRHSLGVEVTRTWQLDLEGLAVTDHLSQPAPAQVYLHLAPNIRVLNAVSRQMELELSNKGVLKVQAEADILLNQNSDYATGFHSCVQNTELSFPLLGTQTFRIQQI